jgi:hypothetical protein
LLELRTCGLLEAAGDDRGVLSSIRGHCVEEAERLVGGHVGGRILVYADVRPGCTTDDSHDAHEGDGEAERAEMTHKKFLVLFPNWQT